MGRGESQRHTVTAKHSTEEPLLPLPNCELKDHAIVDTREKPRTHSATAPSLSFSHVWGRISMGTQPCPGTSQSTTRMNFKYY